MKYKMTFHHNYFIYEITIYPLNESDAAISM
jgi:hypothetical protein